MMLILVNAFGFRQMNGLFLKVFRLNEERTDTNKTKNLSLALPLPQPHSSTWFDAFYLTHKNVCRGCVIIY